MIDVSIIVPIYNSEKYLKKCIDSLIKQTHKNIEILLINDGSTDGSEKVIKKYKDKRIKYISKKNEGIGKTRNLGIEKSKGKYLMFIDSDDYIKKDCVEKMFNYAESNNSDLVVSDFYKDFDGTIKEEIIPSFECTTLKEKPELLNVINLGPCNKLYKRSLIENIKFDEVLKYEDVIFVCGALKEAKRISKIDEFLSYYVVHNNSETTTRDKGIFDILEVNKQLKSMFYEDKKYRENYIDLTVMMLTDYAAQTRYIKDRKIRKDFINMVYYYLNKLDNNWRKRDCFRKINIFKRLIKSSKLLLLIYTDTIGLMYR